MITMRKEKKSNPWEKQLLYLETRIKDTKELGQD